MAHPSLERGGIVRADRAEVSASALWGGQAATARRSIR